MSEEMKDNEQARGDEEEHKVIIRLEQEGALFGDWNPVVLTKVINGLVGDVNGAVAHN